MGLAVCCGIFRGRRFMLHTFGIVTPKIKYTQTDVADEYGPGYILERKRKYLERVALHWPWPANL